MVGELTVRLPVELGLELVLGLDGLKFERLQCCPQIAGCVGSAPVKLGYELRFQDSCNTRCS